MIRKIVFRLGASRWSIIRLEHLVTGLFYAKRTLEVVAIGVIVIVGVQLVYPSGLARPLSSLNGQNTSFWTAPKLSDSLVQASQQPYKLTLGDQVHQVKPADLGIVVNTDKSVSDSLNYSLKQRLVPFSLFIHKNARTYKTVNSAQLNNQLATFAQARNQEPINAVIQKTDNTYKTVLPDKTGYKVDTTALQKEVLRTKFGGMVVVPRTAVAPKLTQKSIEATLANWQAQTTKPVTLRIGDKMVSASPEILRQWAAITTNQAQDTVTISYDSNAIKKWLANYTDEVYVAPKNAVNNLRDQEVTSTENGVDGKALNVDVTTAAIIKGMQEKTPIITATISPVAFKINQNASFSPTSKGLQLLINAWKEQHPSVTTAVSFQEIGGQGRTASLNPNQVSPTASVGKLFTAHYVYSQIQKGALDGNSVILASRNQTIASCLELMIVISDNDCLQLFGNQLGWSAEDVFARANGFAATAPSRPTSTTADTASYLQRLYTGNLLNQEHTASLLDKMSRQIYRQAIPAGSPGSTVYDKVGFINDIWNDAAIVKGSKATYVLVVFTRGGSPTIIKELAQQINDTISPN